MGSDRVFDYPSDPPLECDLIMKGGITSGVIYPLAVCELAQHYRLRAVGGASAGAIAASAAAAAEFGRTRGGFKVVEDLPAWLPAKGSNGRSNLFNLFQPEPETRKLFRVGTACLGRRGFSLAVALVSSALRAFWLSALAGAALGIVLLGAIAFSADGVALAGGIFAAAIVLIVGIVVGIATGTFLSIRKALPANAFGLCSGMPTTQSDLPALTSWLHERLQTAAGRTGGTDQTLTFGDLWRGPDGKGGPKNRQIDLAVMTTNLSEGRPQRMPWDEGGVYFDPEEMRRLFPESVVQWMINNPRDLPTKKETRRESEVERMLALPKRPLPSPENVPVIVATRMSLSFPILLSAVRLWTIDRSYPPNIEAKKAVRDWFDDNQESTPADAARSVPKPQFDSLWFTDGGVCSNFPVHFFDSPLPSRPTFAMNLARFPRGMKEDQQVECRNIGLPADNKSAVAWRWREVGGPGIQGLRGLLTSIVDTARGWVDEGALTMPGYRDRIVTVFHTDKQGGMNLDMPDEVIYKLTERGLVGAKGLRQLFAGPEPGVSKGEGWENQRWVRYRTSIAALEYWLQRFHEVYSLSGHEFETTYRAWLDPTNDVHPPSYRWKSNPQRIAAKERTQALADLADGWFGSEAADFTFDNEAPSPRGVLRNQRKI